MHPILHNLNPEQQEVVTTIEGPLLVLAGAGSGKTRSVIHRAAYLILEKNIAPWNILIVTFTNKAAHELQERLEGLVHINTRNLWVGTFHSVCLRILRRESSYLPFSTKNFSIYDSDDQKALLKKLYKTLQVDPKLFNVGKILNLISKQKNNLMLPQDLDVDESNPFARIFKNVYSEYQKHLVTNAAVDFDDILIYTYTILKENKDLRDKYSKMFPYVMVDEYQDTNYLQFMLIKMLASKNNNLCVVGDDDQAIYSWRGATIRNILGFENDFKKAKIIRLEQNYRSTQAILNVGNALISKNSSRHHKELRTDNKCDKKPFYKVLDRDIDEARYVADSIIKKAKDVYNSWQSFAVLYRTNSQSRLFETIFMERGIPYSLVGTVNFYQRKEIKDILAYLRVMVNPFDTESCLRIINTPARGIGDKSISKLIEYAASEHLSLYDSIIRLDENSQLSISIKKKLFPFRDLLLDWIKQKEDKDLKTFIRNVISDLDFINKYKASDDPKELSRVENIKEFLNSVDEYCERYKNETGEDAVLEDFIQNISLQTNVDRMADKNNSVKLMTLHNAKGLEFDVVYIVGIEEDLLPHTMSSVSKNELEEERRLFYVGITRARAELILTRCELRRSYGSLKASLESRFMDDIPENLIEKENSFSYPIISKKRRSTQPKIVLESEKLFKVGQRVRHEEYGEGVILSVDGKDISAILTISFDAGDLKKIKGSYIEIKL